MDVGIVSLYGWLKIWDNYGTLLQNFALQEALRGMGHRTFWIRTRVAGGHHGRASNPASHIREAAAKLLRPFRGPSWMERIGAFNERNPREFSEFIRRYVPVTEVEYTQAELLADAPSADALISGSDQVWRDVTPVNFLGFGKSTTRRIAYAVSAPWTALGADWKTAAGPFVGRFDSISVREREGLAVCAALGASHAVQVLDPTLLLPREHYRRLVSVDAPARTAPPGSLLAYFVNIQSLSDVPWESTQGAANRLHAPLTVIPLQGAEIVVPAESIFAPTPSGWIHAFDTASAVVTNSYHGALFAVIMQKQFLVFLQSGSTEAENCRFTSALVPLGLGDRILSVDTWRRASASDIANRLQQPIDWDSVESRLEGARTESLRFLRTALSTT